ncbi:LuxR C-terminal-related transcriptional regulator [Microbacterium sp. NPDC056044]|uniref:LuxR C-terminal-related transcriptional regulator n=1 Tax=Microbacterium sp. NPDC056044 TaxID=3345690 RepID=UPI0035DEF500
MPDSDALARPDSAALAVADLYLQRMEEGIAAADYVAVSDAARDGWYEILTARGLVARGLLEAMPANELRHHPVLLMMLGLIYNANAHHRARALRYFATAVVAARRESHAQLAPLDRAVIRIAESAALRLLGRPSLGAGAARAGVRLVDGLTVAERATARNVSRLYTHAGLTLYYGGHTAEALDAFTKGLAEAPASAPEEGFGSLAMLAGIQALEGDLAEARELVERAREEESFGPQRTAYAGTFYHLAEAILALEETDVETAQVHLADAAPRRRVNEHWIVVAEIEAITALVAGRSAEGLAALDATIGQRGAEGRSLRARHGLARARGLLHLALGDVHTATVIAHKDARGADATIARARAALAADKPGTALRELKALAGSALPPRQNAEAVALELAVLARYSHDLRVPALTRRLAAILHRTGLRLPLALLPPDDCRRVLDALTRAGFDALVTNAPASLLVPTHPVASLTNRERAVLEALPDTTSVSELADMLGVSPNTVKSQLRTLYRKLGVTTREDAVAVALELNLLTRTLQVR